ncbi:MAG: chorismate mutase [Bacillota bacterium]|nr:chorismate mutase [Bacillota bacterium]
MNQNIAAYRSHLDRIDERIAALLLERLEIVKKIGEEKRRHGYAVLDQGRETEIRERLSRIATREGEAHYLLQIYEGIMDASKRAQRA